MHLLIFYVEVFFSLSLTLLPDLTRRSRLTWRMSCKKRKLHTFHPVDLLRSVYLIFSVFLLVLCFFLLFVFVQCFVCFMLSWSVCCHGLYVVHSWLPLTFIQPNEYFIFCIEAWLIWLFRLIDWCIFLY